MENGVNGCVTPNNLERKQEEKRTTFVRKSKKEMREGKECQKVKKAATQIDGIRIVCRIG